MMIMLCLAWRGLRDPVTAAKQLATVVTRRVDEGMGSVCFVDHHDDRCHPTEGQEVAILPKLALSCGDDE